MRPQAGAGLSAAVVALEIRACCWRTYSLPSCCLLAALPYLSSVVEVTPPRAPCE